MSKSAPINRGMLTAAYSIGGVRAVIAVFGLWMLFETGNVRIMVITIPAEVLPAVAGAILAISLIVCVAVMLWRYTEHNSKYGLDRGTNKPKWLKFGAVTVIATLMTTGLNVFLAAVLTAYFGIPEPVWYEYVLIGLLPLIITGFIFEFIACEGLSFFAKWAKQKVVVPVVNVFDDAQKFYAGLSDEEKAKFLALFDKKEE